MQKMKKTLTTTLLVLTAGFAFGHGDIELGPNKGRILEFSSDETMHGEVIDKDGKLQIALLDKDMKPVKIEAQTLTATAGQRNNPTKLEVTVQGDAFTLATPTAGDWIILQFKASANAKAVTARLHYDTSKCEPCSNPEWRCGCAEGRS
jgi:hypothetical protein